MSNSKLHPCKQLKFCSFCGSNRVEWRDKKVFCLDCEEPLYFNVASATAGLLFNSKNELLVVTRKNDPGKGTLDLPGGFVDFNETLENGFIREIKEELNLDLALESVMYLMSLSNTYDFRSLTYFTCDAIFYARIEDSMLLNIKAMDDAEKYEFIKIDNLVPESFGLESVKKMINIILQKRAFFENK